jgi:integrase
MIPGITERKGARGTRYKVQVRRAGHPPVTKTFGTLKAAEAFKRKTEGDIENGIASPRLAAKTITLNELIDEYLPTTEALKDWRAIRARVAFWRRELGKLSLANISSERIADVLDDYATDHEPASCNRMLSCLRQILKVAVRRKLVTVNAASKDYVANRKEPTGRKRVITADEWKRLRTAASRSPCDELLPLLVVLKESAMRLSEVTGLTVERVDFERGTAQLFITKNGRPRIVALTAPALDALRSLVPTREGRFFRCNNDQLRFAFNVARDAAGITVDAFGEPLLFHSFRHSLASELAAAGCSVFEIQSVTGHRNVQSLQRYVKTNETTAHAALAKLSTAGAKPA